MKILALIPARGESKRLPNKNILPLGGKPLINWTIEAAKGIPEIVDILVSTDSEEIASVAKSAGALVPWLRPHDLASDTASSIDVCLHALDWYEGEYQRIDGLLLLQPTSPFRKHKTIVEGVKLYQFHSGNKPVVALSPADLHPMWCYKINDNVLEPFVKYSDPSIRSQELPKAYVINGALYLASPNYLRRFKSFTREDTIPLIVNDIKEGLDIDTQWDWSLALHLLTIDSNHQLAQP